MADSPKTETQNAKLPWAPPPDGELTWFLADGGLPASPRPLELTGEVRALVFGLTRALESLDFPINEVRCRRTYGRLYLAAVPSASAERDLARRLQRAHDSGLRYTRNIREGWEAGARREAEGYNTRMAEFGRNVSSARELADQLRPLQRVRGNQWFTAIRSAAAPAAMVQHSYGGALPQDAAAVVRDALGLVADRGATLFQAGISRVAERLVQAGSIDATDDIYWLEWQELREALERAGMWQPLVADRKADAPRLAPAGAPSMMGPALPPDAPRMYLLPEILALLARA